MHKQLTTDRSPIERLRGIVMALDDWLRTLSDPQTLQLTYQVFYRRFVKCQQALRNIVLFIPSEIQDELRDYEALYLICQKELGWAVSAECFLKRFITDIANKVVYSRNYSNYLIEKYYTNKQLIAAWLVQQGPILAVERIALVDWIVALGGYGRYQPQPKWCTMMPQAVIKVLRMWPSLFIVYKAKQGPSQALQPLTDEAGAAYCQEVTGWVDLFLRVKLPVSLPVPSLHGAACEGHTAARGTVFTVTPWHDVVKACDIRSAQPPFTRQSISGFKRSYDAVFADTTSATCT